ncbi:Proline permease [Serratia quinivorans]|uniref:sodium:solute symporter n=1 Tax=Serratia quinivorans TaxID=137545 RepID=UPI00217CA228|nr:sodium:solute symporter [Serratia quinivorans]CAI0915718.1 Proline permease [Serratia quinivorans]CAI0933320.1 Proline permease [Serratia quinivorans]CAI1722198.1 Proline permease [Serratia quinivorans]CAI2091693.1 Proline permease [Serratia quinivorans]CAI2457038.1 Proline permease [Serratia quinivorans]
MNLDLLVVVFYFLVIGAVGWLGVRRATTKEDYLVAGRNLGPCLYLGTLSAVVLGGASTIGSVKLGYTYGISGVWLCGALGAGIVVLSMVLAKPLLKLKLYTVSQVLARRYHPAARVTSGAIMLAYDLMVAVTSIIAIGSVMQVMFDLSFTASILLGGGLVVLYSTLGGMWSLTLTDIIQFIIMTVGMMLVLMPMSIVKAGGWAAFSHLLPDSYYQLSSIGLDTILVFFLIYFFGILIGQDIWQRVFTARSTNIARYAGLGAGVYCVLYGVAGALIGMAGKLVLPHLTNTDGAFAAIAQAVLPPGVSGLVAAAALAALMSTASACLLASSTIALEDVLPALRKRPSGGLAAGRFTTLVMGCIMLGLAFVVRDVMMALTLAYNLLVGGMLIPLIGAIFWQRATSTGAIASMLIGSLSVLALMYYHGIEANSPIYGGLLAGGAAFLIGSLLTRPGPQPQVQPE